VPIENIYGLLPVSIHEVRNIGDAGAFLGQRHEVVTADSRDAETPGARHDLLKSYPDLFGVTIHSQRAEGEAFHLVRPDHILDFFIAEENFFRGGAVLADRIG
jgi:hypothetical protein